MLFHFLFLNFIFRIALHFAFSHSCACVFLESLHRNVSKPAYMEEGGCLLFPFKSSITNTHFSSISFREWIYPQRVESNVQRKGCEFVLLELWRWLERKKIKLLTEPPKRGLWGRLFQAQFRMCWWWSLRLGLQKRYKSIQDSKFKPEKRAASKSNAFCLFS